MADSSRLDELRRRIQRDPASILFAQLADEHLRSGDFEEAVRVCRAGLEYHPDYLSGHVALGRSLMALGRFDVARVVLEWVLRDAPDHLVALRSMQDLRQRHVAPAAASSQPGSPIQPPPSPPPLMPPTVIPSPPPDPALAQLEAWLAAIVSDRR